MQTGVTSASSERTVPGRTRSLSQEIKERAFAEGFEKVGIVPAVPLNEERNQLLTWLERGYHGEMKWMARDPEMRTDPVRLFPPARSVVVVTKNYFTDAQHAEDDHSGKVSRYAWGDDYHDIVATKLRSMLSWIQSEVPEVEGKVCVDIQPMMDKAWAVQAGLGWIGKHSNLITPEYGSWVFIGELLLNLDLEYDHDTIEDHCGTCTLCIDACPTGAITEPYVVDSNKCISYQTIELREPEISPQVAPKLEGWFYGCDICQDVCPWNRFQQVSDEAGFKPRDNNVNVPLADILEMTPESYATSFRGSAMKRAKLSGLQRNARTLLQNR
ncbi:MAG TPA: tRNA epoxyqueuosine(34) reductase QueG [Pyrinomonadaceae bacterium]|nr:tRNA epoxyqueuosine(34) reductase QueG [Pyrinomonadaceae bacterium]